MVEKVICPVCGNVTKIYKNPYPTADVIVETAAGIVLVRRKNPPHGWAIPGGFIDYGETAEEAAVREIKEETGLEIYDLQQFHVYSDPKRDPRFHTLTVVFTAKSSGKLLAGDDAADAAVFFENNLPSPIVFDHENIIQDYFKKKYSK